MNKYIIGAGLVAVILIFASAYVPVGKDGPKNIKVASAITVEDSSYEFGEIEIFGGKVTTEFPLTNTGSEPVTITDGTTSCACTNGEIDGIGFGMHEGMGNSVTIEPGETKMLEAVYDPLFHGPNGTGKITRELILQTNSTETPEVKVRLSANVIKTDK